MNKFRILLSIVSITFLSLGVSISGCNLFARIYNKIIDTKETLNQSLADLNTEYQRRYALINNLVVITQETKLFEEDLIKIEKEIYIKVAEAKAAATKMDITMPEGVKNKIKKENELSMLLVNALDKLIVMAQHYPQITDPQIKDRNKTFESLTILRNELKSIEEDVLAARKAINKNVKFYNQIIQSFPANIIAGWGEFKMIEYWDLIDEEAKKDVKIKF